MEAIILVGGRGSRLGALTENYPKPMLPIRGYPFLLLLLSELRRRGILRVILAVGYKREIIQEYFTKSFSAPRRVLPEISFSIERNPLGTGGAIYQALPLCDEENIFICNGDTFLDVDLCAMKSFHVEKRSALTIASVYEEAGTRYGYVDSLPSKKIRKLKGKGTQTAGYINGGVYLANVKKISTLMKQLGQNEFSFELDVLENNIGGIDSYEFRTRGQFLDIGIPADYERAQKELFLE